MNITIKIISILIITISVLGCSSDDSAGVPEVITLSADAQVTSFTFGAADNTALAEDITGIIDENAKTITVQNVPLAAITNLIPKVNIADGASVNASVLSATDYTTPVAIEVTAQDDTTSTYTIIVQVSERDVLKAIYDANPQSQSLLDWDVEDPNSTIDDWEGVTMANGRIISLVLDNKKLKTLPSAIGFLTALKELNFYDNDLSEIPKEIGQLSRLESLHFSSNVIEILPSTIGQLSNLQELFLDGNEIEVIPPEIGALQNLLWLFFTSNRITEIPKEIGSLRSLESLSLSFNSLTNIPVEIGNLKSLRYLSLYNSELTTLPSEIGQLYNLEGLALGSTPLVSIPDEVCQLQYKEPIATAISVNFDSENPFLCP